ncbi:unnamed protein product [Cuscuta campestris]|uniref:RRM domain-containing protein n=2 Tax=Cuscuta sect. Cleistogrammica TaxID=1824901 RepID=A0A484L7Z3_9ASTE|nr:hypothetical protein DM860_005737 [Cuscuta australis]VFQ72469.1 unnamed protein product [Cuscuta campestris]
MFEIETGTKLYVSNLGNGVSEEDINILFSEFGDMKWYAIHYDKNGGGSKGTAEVVYSRRQDALAAFKRYNNAKLDGKPVKIEIVGTNAATGNSSRVLRRREGRRRGRGRGRRDSGGGKVVSAIELDADLDKYHSEAMQID